jgi:GxxExxY protein
MDTTQIIYTNIFELAKKVYKNLGPGHTEFIYHRAMEIELRLSSINYETEKRVIINYIDENQNHYSIGEERIDLYLRLENNIEVIVELKAVINKPKELEYAQLRKYYRELNKINIKPLHGILINFPQPGVKPAREDIDYYEILF